MKKFLLLLVLGAFIKTITIAQQTPFLEWQKSLGGDALEKIRSIKQTIDGGYILAGHSFSNNGNVSGNHGENDYWIVKLDADRNIQWKKMYGGSSFDYTTSVQQTSDTGYVVAGYTLSNDGDVSGNHGGYDYWIIKLDKKGNLIWQKTFGGSNNDFATSVWQTFDGGYAVAGFTSSNDGDVSGNHGFSDVWILKLDADGNLVWQKIFGTINNDQAYSIQQTEDAGYIVAGYTDVIGKSRDYYILKLDTAGNLQWQKKYGGSNAEVALSIQQTTNGGYIVGGYSDSNDGDVSGNHGDSTYDYWILRLTSGGSIKWQKSFGGSGNDYAYSAQQTNDGNFVITGNTESIDGNVSFNHGGYDYWVLKLDTTGKIIWQKSLGGSANDSAYGGDATSDGGYVIGGETFSTNGNISVSKGNGDYWVTKLSPDSLNDNLSIQSYNVASDCSSNNSITLKIQNDALEYKVRLYRFGVLFDSALNVTSQAVFNNLTNGVYYATATSHKVVSTSSQIALIPVPTNISVTNITSNKAEIDWAGFNCANSYSIQYRVQGAASWKSVDTTALSYTLKKLLPGTTYVCRVASQKSKNGITGTSKYSDTVVFTTTSPIANTNQSNNISAATLNSNQLNVSPNPAKNSFTIFFNTTSTNKVNAILYDVNGKAVWISGLTNASSINSKTVNTTSFARGVYYLKLMDEDGKTINTTKVVVAN